MPTSAEHGQRVKEGLAFIQDAVMQKYHNELVTARFYTCLHMFEAAVFDFVPKPRKRHFFTHGERTMFLSSVRFDSNSPFFAFAADFEALRGLSEQARYLSPAGVETYEPLRVPADVQQAEVLFNSIRQHLEGLYQSSGKKPPWL